LKALKKQAVGRQKQRERQAERGVDVPAGAAGGASASGARAKGTEERRFEPAHKYFVSNNWKALLERRPNIAPRAAVVVAESVSASGNAAPDVVALDCEMVGTGPTGSRSVLARVSIVDYEGNVLLDKFVRPEEAVTDYRSHITGITAATLQRPGVLKEATARRIVSEIIEGKIVVGHALNNDFEALVLSHPHALIRDTSTFKPLRPPGREKKTPSLAFLSQHWFGQTLHEGQHDSVEDARAALRLYTMRSRMWEKQMRGAMKSARNASAEEPGEDEDEEGEVVVRGDAPPVAAKAGASVSPAKKRGAVAEDSAESPAAGAATPADGGTKVNPGKKARKRMRALQEVEQRKAGQPKGKKRRKGETTGGAAE